MFGGTFDGNTVGHQFLTFDGNTVGHQFLTATSVCVALVFGISNLIFKVSKIQLLQMLPLVSRNFQLYLQHEFSCVM